ncbi:MAG TPA: sugar nucleotide-binding protein [Kiritimatiellia bacterium]|nr:sugar nucleotide-binding protein [Kiritimatiellia bacterium]
MHVLVTGGNGTLGSALRAEAARRGDAFTAWERATCQPDDMAGLAPYLARIAPDALVHAAVPSTGTGRPDEGRLVNIEWTARLARAAAERGLPFLYISTVMVFTDNAKGPFTPESEPDAKDGYGFEKLQGERAARDANPEARIARIGWQIGEQPGGNHMLSFFVDKMRTEGVIRASTKWLPATSFLPDTAAALLDLLAMPASLYHVNANTHWTFFEIATALNALHGGSWRVEPNEDFVYDQRLFDPRVPIPPLSARLSELKNLPHNAHNAQKAFL